MQIIFWNDHAQLLATIDNVLETQFGIRGNDEAAFDRSLVIVYHVLAALGLSPRYEEPLIAKCGDPNASGTLPAVS